MSDSTWELVGKLLFRSRQIGKKKEQKEKKQRGLSSRSSSSSRPGLEQTASQEDPTGSSRVNHDDDIASVLSQSSSGGDRRLGNTQVSSQISHGTSGSKSPARRRAHSSTPIRSQSGDLVGKYGVQASATDLEALPLGPNPHQAILSWGYLSHTAPFGLNQNARWKDPLLATPVIVPG